MKRKEKPSLTEIVRTEEQAKQKIHRVNFSNTNSHINISDLNIDEVTSNLEYSSHQFPNGNNYTNSSQQSGGSPQGTCSVATILEVMNQSKRNLDLFLEKLGNIKFRTPDSEYLKQYLKIPFDPIETYELFSQLYEIDVQKMISSKVLKRNWNKDDIVLLIWIAEKYSQLHNIHLDNLQDEDWNYIQTLIPGKTMESCKFKWLSMAKVSSNRLTWTKKENKILQQLVLECLNQNQTIQWVEISKDLFKRNGETIFRSSKQCREHYNNFLDPSLKSTDWTLQEDITLINLQKQIGNKWSDISKQIPGRTDNKVKNRYMSLKNKQVNNLEAIKLYHSNKGVRSKHSSGQSEKKYLKEQSSINEESQSGNYNYQQYENNKINQDLKSRNNEQQYQQNQQNSPKHQNTNNNNNHNNNNNIQRQEIDISQITFDHQDHQQQQHQQPQNQDYLQSKEDYGVGGMEDNIYLDSEDVYPQSLNPFKKEANNNNNNNNDSSSFQDNSSHHNNTNSHSQEVQSNYAQNSDQEDEEYIEEKQDVVNNMNHQKYRHTTQPYHFTRRISLDNKKNEDIFNNNNSNQNNGRPNSANKLRTSIQNRQDMFTIRQFEQGSNGVPDNFVPAYIDLETKEIYLLNGTQNQDVTHITQQCLSLQSINSKQNLQSAHNSKRTSILLTPQNNNELLTQVQQFSQKQQVQSHPLEHIMFGFPHKSLNSSLNALKGSNDDDGLQQQQSKIITQDSMNFSSKFNQNQQPNIFGLNSNLQTSFNHIVSNNNITTNTGIQQQQQQQQQFQQNYMNDNNINNNANGMPFQNLNSFVSPQPSINPFGFQSNSNKNIAMQSSNESNMVNMDFSGSQNRSMQLNLQKESSQIQNYMNLSSQSPNLNIEISQNSTSSVKNLSFLSPNLTNRISQYTNSDQVSNGMGQNMINSNNSPQTFTINSTCGGTEQPRSFFNQQSKYLDDDTIKRRSSLRNVANSLAENFCQSYKSKRNSVLSSVGNEQQQQN